MARNGSGGSSLRRPKGSNDATRPANKTPCVLCRLKKTGCDKSTENDPCSKCKKLRKPCDFAPTIKKDPWRHWHYNPPEVADGTQHDSPTTTCVPRLPSPSSPNVPDDHNYTSNPLLPMPIDPVPTPRQATPNFVNPDQSFPQAQNPFEIVVNWSNEFTHRLTVRSMDGDFVVVEEHFPNLPGPSLKYLLENRAAEYCAYYWLEADPIWEERLYTYLDGLVMVFPTGTTRPTRLNPSVMLTPSASYSLFSSPLRSISNVRNFQLSVTGSYFH